MGDVKWPLYLSFASNEHVESHWDDPNLDESFRLSIIINSCRGGPEQLLLPPPNYVSNDILSCSTHGSIERAQRICDAYRACLDAVGPFRLCVAAQGVPRWQALEMATRAAEATGGADDSPSMLGGSGGSGGSGGTFYNDATPYVGRGGVPPSSMSHKRLRSRTQADMDREREAAAKREITDHVISYGDVMQMLERLHEWLRESYKDVDDDQFAFECTSFDSEQDIDEELPMDAGRAGDAAASAAVGRSRRRRGRPSKVRRRDADDDDDDGDDGGDGDNDDDDDDSDDDDDDDDGDDGGGDGDGAAAARGKAARQKRVLLRQRIAGRVALAQLTLLADILDAEAQFVTAFAATQGADFNPLRTVFGVVAGIDADAALGRAAVRAAAAAAAASSPSGSVASAKKKQADAAAAADDGDDDDDDDDAFDETRLADLTDTVYSVGPMPTMRHWMEALAPSTHDAMAVTEHALRGLELREEANRVTLRSEHDKVRALKEFTTKVIEFYTNEGWAFDEIELEHAACKLQDVVAPTGVVSALLVVQRLFRHMLVLYYDHDVKMRAEILTTAVSKLRYAMNKKRGPFVRLLLQMTEHDRFRYELCDKLLMQNLTLERPPNVDQGEHNAHVRRLKECAASLDKFHFLYFSLQPKAANARWSPLLADWTVTLLTHVLTGMIATHAPEAYHAIELVDDPFVPHDVVMPVSPGKQQQRKTAAAATTTTTTTAAAAAVPLPAELRLENLEMRTFLSRGEAFWQDIRTIFTSAEVNVDDDTLFRLDFFFEQFALMCARLIQL